MTDRPGRPVPAHLIAAGMLLAANALLIHIGWQALGAPSIPMVAATSGRDGEATMPEPLDMASFPAEMSEQQHSRDALERPLFMSSRRPYQPPPEPAVEPAALAETEAVEEILPLDYLLAGVVIDNTHRRALLRDHASTVDRWVNEGETVNNWRLVRVEPASVTLEAGSLRTTLELYPSLSTAP